MMFYVFSFSGISPLDLLAQTSEISRLQQTLQEKDDTINKLKAVITEKDQKIRTLVKETADNSKFGVSRVLKQQKKLKGLFKILHRNYLC